MSHPESLQGKFLHSDSSSFDSGCTINRKKNHNLYSKIYAVSFLDDHDSLACISLCIQITLHSRVLLFTLQQLQMFDQSHSQGVKQNTVISAIRPEISQRFSHTTQSPLSFLFLIYGAPLSLTVATVTRSQFTWSHILDTASKVSCVDKQEGGRSQFT